MPIVIPPLIAWTLGAIGVGVVAKVLIKEWRRVNAELNAGEAAADAGQERLPKLRRDPASGVYRPE
jgi:hypothetical protein